MGDDSYFENFFKKIINSIPDLNERQSFNTIDYKFESEEQSKSQEKSDEGSSSPPFQMIINENNEDNPKAE